MSKHTHRWQRQRLPSEFLLFGAQFASCLEPLFVWHNLWCVLCVFLHKWQCVCTSNTLNFKRKRTQNTQTHLVNRVRFRDANCQRICSYGKKLQFFSNHELSTISFGLLFSRVFSGSIRTAFTRLRLRFLCFSLLCTNKNSRISIHAAFCTHLIFGCCCSCCRRREKHLRARKSVTPVRFQKQSKETEQQSDLNHRRQTQWKSAVVKNNTKIAKRDCPCVK